MQTDPAAAWNIWLIVRIGFCLIGLIQSYFFIAEMPGDFSQPSWLFFFEMAGFSIFGIIFVHGMWKLNRWVASDWGTPSWLSNPFAVNRPLQLFHAGAWYLIAVGIGCLILGMARTPKTWVWEIPLSLGIGMLVGVQITKPHRSDRGGS